MKHYCHALPNGDIEVQNAVAGFPGQLHTHTPDDFRRWKRESRIKEENIDWLGKEAAA